MKTIIKNNNLLFKKLVFFNTMFFSIMLSSLAWSSNEMPVQDEYTDPSVQSLIESMSEALRKLNYQGRFMYVVAGKMSSFEVQHAVFDGKEHERLVFLNEKKQEIVRVGHDLYCVHPGGNLLRQHDDVSANPFLAKLSKLSKELYDSYETSIQSNKMVAGREVYKVNFKSKDTNRYDHSFWIDEESFLLLKADISDPILGVLESFEYIQVDIGLLIPMSEFQHEDYIRHSAKHFEPNLDHGEDLSLVQQKSKSGWQSTWLPKGFYFSGDESSDSNNSMISNSMESDLNESGDTLTPQEDSLIQLTMLMYTDGVAAITVFIEEVEKPGKFSESSQMGATSAFSHAASVSGKSYMITAVGEVQLQTVERIAKSVELIQ